MRMVSGVLCAHGTADKASRHVAVTIDDGRFADTRISGNEHQLRPAARYHSFECGKQRIHLVSDGG